MCYEIKNVCFESNITYVLISELTSKLWVKSIISDHLLIIRRDEFALRTDSLTDNHLFKNEEQF